MGPSLPRRKNETTLPFAVTSHAQGLGGLGGPVTYHLMQMTIDDGAASQGAAPLRVVVYDDQTKDAEPMKSKTQDPGQTKEGED